MKTGKMVKKMRRGFSLVELMIAVLIMSVLLAIAAPNFVRARESSRAKACSANLKAIQGAKEQWAIETNQSGAARPGWANLVGPAAYLRKRPACKSGGTYLINNITLNPTCTVSVNGAGDWDDHMLP
jgi:prepilin-type N-terminal cleavage/methylation domain-containing protein